MSTAKIVNCLRMFFIFFTACLQAQNIFTVAGNGTAGFSGDGGPATLAEFNVVQAVAVDSLGNFYIGDVGNNRVRKVDISTGNIFTAAGNGTAGFGGDGGSALLAELNFPDGVAVDSLGNFYIADTSNSRIRKVSGGIINTIAGNGTAGFSGDGGPAISAELDFPSGVAVDSLGNVYIADTSNNRIRIVSGGIINTVAGNGSPGFRRTFFPQLLQLSLSW